MKYTIGIDIGTSGTKSAIFDVTGKRIASATVEYPLYQPQRDDNLTRVADRHYKYAQRGEAFGNHQRWRYIQRALITWRII